MFSAAAGDVDQGSLTEVIILRMHDKRREIKGEARAYGVGPWVTICQRARYGYVEDALSELEEAFESEKRSKRVRTDAMNDVTG